MKDGGRARQRRYSIGRKYNKRKKKMSGRGHTVKHSNESKSDMMWQPWMCLQDSGKNKGNVSLSVSLPW